MDCLLPPLTAIPHGTWECPLRTPRQLLLQTAARHLRLPSPILDFDTDQIMGKKKYDSLSVIRASRLPTTIRNLLVFALEFSRSARTNTHQKKNLYF